MEKRMGTLREFTLQHVLFTEMSDPHLQAAFFRTSRVGFRLGFAFGGVLGTLIGGVLVGVGVAWMR